MLQPHSFRPQGTWVISRLPAPRAPGTEKLFPGRDVPLSGSSRGRFRRPLDHQASTESTQICSLFWKLRRTTNMELAKGGSLE